MKFSGRYGRLKYSSRDRAEGVADRLGLAGIHRHDDRDPDNDGRDETVYMPGNDHRNLNDALRDRGKEPTMVPGEGDMGNSDGGGFGFGGDSTMTDMMDLGGEMAGTGTRDDQLRRDENDMGSNAGFLLDTESVFGEGDDDDDDEMDIY